ncbi:MAG: molybdate transporter family protein [Pseudomonadota bacterium]
MGHSADHPQLSSDAPSGVVGNPFRFDLRELSGALADLGTLAPLAVGLVAVCGVGATALFLVTGVMYLVVAGVYRLPIPLQPLKAAGAIAIAGALPVGAIAAAAWIVAGVLALLAWTGGTARLSRLFTRPVIRGIQLGVGLILVKKGILFMLHGGGPDPRLVLGDGAGLALAFLVAGVLAVGVFRPRVPSVLLVLVLSAAAGLLAGTIGMPPSLVGPEPLAVVVPSREEWLLGLVVLAIPQLPLTLGNAVVATEDCARVYFKDRARHVTATRLSSTMAIGNVLAGLLGGMPMCHGSGGLTAHVRFGARSGAAPAMLGAIFLTIGLAFGSGAQGFLLGIPPVTIGLLMAWIGVHHALLVKDLLADRLGLSIAGIVGLTGLLSSNLAVAFVLGMVLEVLRKVLMRHLVSS